MKLRRYTIKKGQQNFKPLDNFLPKFGKKKFYIKFKLDRSCYYSKADWNYDGDWNDWNKLKGITYYFSANDKQSAMLAWRPSSEKNSFEVAAYVNDKTGGFKYESLGIVKANETILVHMILEDKSVVFIAPGSVREIKFRRPFVLREIGTWIGGKNNSKGPYGGKASKDMHLFAKMKCKY